MLEYQPITVYEAVSCTCDRCSRRLTSADMEWHEKLSLSFTGGYTSVFGDGSRISIDLCQQCLKQVLGPWLRITHS
ncbi:hypothetical protein Y046_2866 [Burkholderia pseudomallei MSHR2990]|nr:hypothetical protein Y046_2866 [Burkholderia pseudomallei MSHR2990]PRH17075.1 hypothetical protein C6T71_28445 [Burkholderia multivorans]